MDANSMLDLCQVATLARDLLSIFDQRYNPAVSLHVESANGQITVRVVQKNGASRETCVDLEKCRGGK